jgi:hypothetical protein
MKDMSMNITHQISARDKIRRHMCFFGASALFIALAGFSQAQPNSDLYPQENAQHVRTANVVRGCTPLEIEARMSAPECGTLTLTEVMKQWTPINGRLTSGGDDRDRQIEDTVQQ